MKIGILTFHSADNYGAVLQAYGLQEYLVGLGHEVYLIDYKPKYLTAPYRIFVKSHAKGNLLVRIKYLCRSILVIPIRLRRNRLFNSFRKKYLKICKLDLNNPVNDVDAFIFGSDQIWDPIITCGLDTIYMGDFPAADSKKKIAYAASVRSVSDLEEKKGLFRQHLSKFCAIGVRERTIQKFLDKIVTDEQCNFTIDPVLLAGRTVFDKLAKQKCKGQYLFLFQLGYNVIVANIASRIALEKGLEIISMSSSSESIIKNKKIISSASPEQFLSYVKDAMYVVTTSYHCIVFSLLFQKDFTAVCLDEKGGERIANLLQELGLSSRLVTSSGQNSDTNHINYSIVQDKCQMLRKESKVFLYEALNKNV